MGMSRARRLISTVVAVAALATLVACNPDPTGGKRPPPPGASGVPAFEATVKTVVWAGVPTTWRPGCPVHYNALRVVRMSYWGYDGRRHLGDMVVNQSVVASIQSAFHRLYAARVQIRRIATAEVHQGDDDALMAANITSAFNCRRVAESSSWSQHSYGTAIDINPIQNPYVSGSTVSPPAGRSWLDRGSVTPGMAVAGGPLVAAFDAIGWGWGGRWTSSKDYQHFSANGR